MDLIPLVPIPSQTLSVTLGGQRCRLNVYAKTYGLYVDVYVADALIVAGVQARNLTRIVRSAYLGFVGELAFYDTQGADDPVYDQLGSRFVLLYSDAAS